MAKQGSMRVMGVDQSQSLNYETHRVPVSRAEDRFGGNAAKKIYESTKQLKERN